MSNKILLVEDEALIAINEAQMLKKHGYEVVTAYNGEKAIKAVDSDLEISLILMDLDLGKGMDGTEAAEQILNKKDIPVVFLSSHTEPEVVEKTEGITSYGYIVKNSGETVLLASIRMAFRLFEARMKEKEHKEKLQFQATILDRIGDYVTATDLNGRITYVNEAECALFGKSRDEIIGQTTAIFGEDPGYGTTQKEIVETTIKEGTWRGEVVNFDRNNNRTVMDCRTWPIRDRNNIAHTLVGIATDVTKQKKIEDKLRKSEKKYRYLFETMMPGVVYQSADGTIISANPAAEKLLGLTVDHVNGKTSMAPRWKMVDEEGKDVSGPEHPAMVALRTGEKVGPVDRAVFIPERNEYIWISITAIPLFFESYDKPYRVYTTFNDITERRRAEDTLREALKEKEFLMKELNHRVKNNLAMVSSLINLKELETEADLSDIQHQVGAISLIHEKLYQTGNITEIGFRDYISDLLNSIFSSFSRRPVKIETNIAEISIPTKSAMSLGLIVNEIATNAIKHGFNEKEDAVFSVGMKEDRENSRYELTLSNTGNPFPKDIDVENPQTLGLRLISALTEQLGGTIELKRKPHPVFAIRFPIEEE